MGDPSRIGERFVLEDTEPLRGGMSVIHQARDERTGRRVALKIVNPTSDKIRQRFHTEWELLARMRHPGIVEHLDHGETPGGALYMAMEWLDGEDLASRLGRGRLNVEDTLAIAGQVASALGEVHRHGIVHRDVKPANIYMPGLRAHAAKLLDFGVAKVDYRRMTGAGAFVGTPGYLAPEQARGSNDITAATDVFALGLVLYECLTGLPVYSGSNPMSLLVKVAVQPPPRLEEERPDLSSGLTALITKMLAPRVEDRFADGGEVARALERLDARRPSGSWRELSPATLTERELELLSVVLVAPAILPSDEVDLDHTQETNPIEVPGQVIRMLEEAAVPLETLVDGSILATVRARAAADAQAGLAARLALGLAEGLVDHTVALATGRAPMSSRGAIGEVLDRVARLADTARGVPTGGAGALPSVAIDPLTAELVGARFEVREADDRLTLIGERDDVLHDATLTGRGLELGSLLTGWDGERPRVIQVSGPAGIGKSALLGALAGRLRERHPALAVLSTRCDPVGAGRTFGVLAGLLRSALGLGPRDGEQVRRERLRLRVDSRLEEIERPHAMAFLGELLGVAPEDDGRTTQERMAVGVDPSLKGEQLRRAWERWLRAEREAGPVLILVDDADFADTPSMRTLGAVLERLHGGGVMAVVAARDAAPGLEGAEELPVGALPEEAAREIAREALGPLGSDPDVDRIVGGAAGNPLFLKELAMAVLVGEESLPPSLVALTQSQLSSLPAPARRVLRAASVLGVVVEQEAIRRLLGPDAESLLAEGRPELIERGLVQLEGDRLRFETSLLREAAYASLTQEDRRAGHGLAARLLSERGDVDPLVLAEHWSASAEPERAIGPLRAAVEMALAGHDFERVVSLARKAEELGAEGPELGEILVSVADALRWKGEVAAGLEAAERALTLCPERSDAWFAALNLELRLRHANGDREGLLRCASRLLALELRPQDRLPGAVTLARAVASVVGFGAYDVAAVAAARMDEVVDELRSVDASVGAWVHYARASLAQHRQDLVEFREELLLAAEHFRAIGDARMEAVASMNAGYALIEIGAPKLAQRELERATEVAQSLGIRRVTAAARHNLASALMRQGRADDAVEILREAEHAFDEMGERRLRGSTRFYLAEAFRMLGRRDLAREMVELALADLEATPPLFAGGLALSAQILLDLGETAAALERASHAYRLSKELGQLEVREELVLLVYAKALEASGQHEHARQAIEVAARRLEERASRIDDPLWRERFLRGSPARVETLLLRDEQS